MLQYLIILFITLPLLSVHSTSKYLLLYLPYTIIILSLAITSIAKANDNSNELINQKTPLLKRITLVVTLVFAITHTYSNCKVAFTKYDPNMVQTIIDNNFDKNIEPLKIIAPISFIFNGIEQIDVIQSDLGIIDRIKTGEKLSNENLLIYASKNNIKYIITSPQDYCTIGLNNLHEQDFKKNGFVHRKNILHYIMLENINLGKTHYSKYIGLRYCYFNQTLQ